MVNNVRSFVFYMLNICIKRRNTIKKSNKKGGNNRIKDLMP